MMIGALGNIPFYVTMSESQLLSGLMWNSGARYSEHARHGETDMLEYVGSNPDQITFDLKLSAFLGTNPTKMLDSLKTLHKNHSAVRFALGTMIIPGSWVLSDMEVSLEHFHKDGTLLSADVSITLKEYVETVKLPVIANKISFINRMTGDGRIPPAVTTPPTTPPSVSTQPIGTGTITLSNPNATAPVLAAPQSGARVIGNYKHGTVTGIVEHIGAYYGVLHAGGPMGIGYILTTYFTLQGQLSAPSRKPVVPATTKPVTMSATPVTKPVVSPAAVKNVAAAVKKLPAVANAIGAKVVSSISNLGVVQIIKNAFTNTNYTAVKETPAKPVIVKSVNKNKTTAMLN